MTSGARGERPAIDIAWVSVFRLAAVLLLFAVGSRIPLPGLDHQTLHDVMQGQDPSFISRVSIFALGAMPLLGVLAHLEILRLFVPAFARWEARSDTATRNVRIAVVVLALIIASMQGYGISEGIAMSGLAVSAGWAFTATTITCFVASTALMIWISETVRLPWGLSGFWLLMAASLLTSLPGEIANSFWVIRTGGLPASSGVAVLMFLGISLVLVVFANLLLHRLARNRAAELAASPLPPMALLLWPPFLAATLGGYLIVVPALLFSGFLASHMAIQVTIRLLIAMMIPLFVYLYARRFDLLSRPNIKPVLLAVIGVQLFVTLGAGIVTQITMLPVTLDGRLLIALVSVLAALLTVRFAR